LIARNTDKYKTTEYTKTVLTLQPLKTKTMAIFSGNVAHDAQEEDKTSIRVAMNRSSWQLNQNH
jgi:hypothetical protein